MSYQKELIEQFSSRLKSAKKELGSTMDAVSNGVPPTEETLAELNSSLKSFRDSYEELRTLALEVDNT